MTSYATTLDAADRLSLEEQEELAATPPASVAAIVQRIRA